MRVVGSNAVVYRLQFTANPMNSSAWHYVMEPGAPVTVIGTGVTTNTLGATNLVDGIRVYRLMSVP